ncbi:TlpA disulfide reductase family protein [Tepidimonas charontis]|uniref:Thiol-disulfide oxidoreductase ResA n=1 Tax=Tepidimonas charontis TaxID=2267262 RepID=A0A554X498_9BURK|nr:TlpA disulfide reductase family protein [Tepidimonas charontis]TSE30671.1 Thiol-disulfide oxidoreductase ResA [Tepidimonas charontis]
MTPRWRPWLLTAPLWPTLTALSGCAGGEQAPASTFRLLDGRTLTPAEWQGRVVLVNFWATTCASCVKEMPQLVQTYQRFRERGFETIAVAMSYDRPEWVANFARTRQLPFPVALDSDGALARAWGDVKLTPTTYVVDRRSRIVKRYVGEPDFNALAALLEQLLNAS